MEVEKTRAERLRRCHTTSDQVVQLVSEPYKSENHRSWQTIQILRSDGVHQPLRTDQSTSGEPPKPVSDRQPSNVVDATDLHEPRVPRASQGCRDLNPPRRVVQTGFRPGKCGVYLRGRRRPRVPGLVRARGVHSSPPPSGVWVGARPCRGREDGLLGDTRGRYGSSRIYRWGHGWVRGLTRGLSSDCWRERGAGSQGGRNVWCWRGRRK